MCIQCRVIILFNEYDDHIYICKILIIMVTYWFFDKHGNKLING